MPAPPTATAPAKAVSQLNPETSLRSTLRRAPIRPAEKLQVAAALAGLKNQRGLAFALGLRNEVSLSRAINSKNNMGQEIRRRAAELLGLEVADFWRPGQGCRAGQGTQAGSVETGELMATACTRPRPIQTQSSRELLRHG